MTINPTIKPKKKFGQNFLKDTDVIQKIISCLNLKQGEQIVEIGPGQGALTCSLLPISKSLTAIEVDKRLIPELKLKCKNLGRLTLFEQDVLKFNFNQLAQKPSSLRLIGNLPYSISTPLLFHLMHYKELIKDMHFMLQKEVADRITAKPGNKTYGRLSVMLQYHCKTVTLFDVPPTAFYPKPKVDSTVIHLIPFKKTPYKAENFDFFELLVRESFNHRRKTLFHTLKKFAPTLEIPWESLNINPQARPETLSVEDFVNISNVIKLV